MIFCPTAPLLAGFSHGHRITICSTVVAYFLYSLETQQRVVKNTFPPFHQVAFGHSDSVGIIHITVLVSS